MSQAITAPPGRTGLLEFHGSGAAAFLQAQLASDVDALTPGRWQWSAWLDAQGRVRAVLQLARMEADRFLALPRGGDAAVLAQSLARYVLRAPLRIEVRETVLRAAPALPLHTCTREDDALYFGMGGHAWLALPSAAATAAADDRRTAEAWRAEIDAGWAWLPATALDALLPPALGLEHLRAVVFDKGCYPGQEIAARLHYRGGHKRHLVTLAGAPAAIRALLDAHTGSVLPLCLQQGEPSYLLGVLNRAGPVPDTLGPLLRTQHAD